MENLNKLLELILKNKENEFDFNSLTYEEELLVTYIHKYFIEKDKNNLNDYMEYIKVNRLNIKK